MSHTRAQQQAVIGIEPRLAYPQSLRRVLRYSDAWYLAAPSGGTTYRQFCVNGCYDIDVTGTGHQPRSFDQFCSATGPYVIYRVLGVKVVATIAPMFVGAATPPAQQPIICCMGFSTSGTNPATASGSVSANIWTFTEIPGWVGTIVPQGKVTTLSLDRSLESIFGIPKAHLLGDDNYQGVYNANPADPAYMYFTYQCGDFTTTGQSFLVTLSFELDVQFEAPLFQTAS